MNRTLLYLIISTCFSFLFVIRYGLLIFLEYWKHKEISSTNIILFVIGIILSLTFFYKAKKAKKQKILNEMLTFVKISLKITNITYK
ncbi:hypothetical protein D0U04_19515 [Bacillus clarus]|uniref:Uncharacterized protein n=1 Tax=Bacillus clarus TaxID=2338372 RepID=A0A090YUR4_9BACI|nr:hypothetical protein DJ93_4265 [Bacillus clarus]RFT65438.1 hypothetical protein D0U04_19515 [Bacillus clarus]